MATDGGDAMVTVRIATALLQTVSDASVEVICPGRRDQVFPGLVDPLARLKTWPSDRLDLWTG